MQILRSISRLRGSIVLPSFALLSGLLSIFLLRSSWDPDPHHDGVMYAAAIAIRDGLLPNRDVFAQYGPLSPAIQGLWLKLFGPELLNLRILNALLLTTIGLLLFRLCRRRVGTVSAGLLALSWALTCPRPCQHSCANLFTSNNLPWPSVFSTLIIMVTLTLLDSLRVHENSAKRRRLVFGFAGFLLVIGSFARIQLVASFVLVVFLLFWRRSKERSGKEEYAFLLGGLISAVLSLSLLIKFGIWQAFVDQCILWSSHNYGKSPINVQTLLNVLWFPGIALAFVALWAVLSRAMRTRNKILKSLILSMPTAIFLSVTFILDVSGTNSPNSRVHVGKILVDISSNLLSGLGYICVAYVLYQLIPKSIHGSSGQASQIEDGPGRNLSHVAFLGIAASALFQLYPLFDPLHLWWITPVLISGALGGSTLIPVLIKSHQTIARSILVGLTIAGIFQLAATSESNRIPFRNLALHGMKASPVEVRRLDATMLMLEKFGIARHIKFFCADGLYSAAGGKYLAPDGNFVDWGPVSSKADGGDYSQIFVCDVKSDSIKDFQKIGWKLIFSTVSEKGSGIDALFE